MRDKVEQLIKELQERSDWMQNMVEQNIKDNRYDLALNKHTRHSELEFCIRELNSILNSENTEGVSTTPPKESGDLHDVDERHASRNEPTKDSEVVAEGALKNRTSSESNCKHSAMFKMKIGVTNELYCLICGNRSPAIEKEE